MIKERQSSTKKLICEEKVLLVLVVWTCCTKISLSKNYEQLELKKCCLRQADSLGAVLP